jgi:hypothetical protein
MPILRNPRHERFAQLRASGKTGSDSYREAVSSTAQNPDVNAAKLASRPGVRERIEELKAETADKCSLSREAYIKLLVETLEAKPSEASMDNPRCDVLVTRGVKHAIFPLKLAVGAQLSKLVGWDAPTKVEIEAGSELASLLGRLFTAGGTLGNSGFCDNGERSQPASGSASTRH